MSRPGKREILDYQKLARQIRVEILNMVYRAKAPHIGSSFSMVELLVALYFVQLRVDPANTDDKERDIFILSKGHGCPALYSTLACRGFFDPSILHGFGIDGGRLELHPTRDTKMGIEVSTGSLGHGLSIGAGMALAAKFDGTPRKVYVLLGDGEMNEGSVWEAAMLAAQYKLSNLVAIIDYNKIQALGNTQDVIGLEPFADKWHSFGWEVKEINGHDFNQIISTFKMIPFNNRPSSIIAHTVKGKGVSFMENKLLWHYRSPDENEYYKALQELS